MQALAHKSYLQMLRARTVPQDFSGSKNCLVSTSQQRWLRLRVRSCIWLYLCNPANAREDRTRTQTHRLALRSCMLKRFKTGTDAHVHRDRVAEHLRFSYMMWSFARIAPAKTAIPARRRSHRKASTAGKSAFLPGPRECLRDLEVTQIALRSRRLDP